MFPFSTRKCELYFNLMIGVHLNALVQNCERNNIIALCVIQVSLKGPEDQIIAPRPRPDSHNRRPGGDFL